MGKNEKILEDIRERMGKELEESMKNGKPMMLEDSEKYLLEYLERIDISEYAKKHGATIETVEEAKKLLQNNTDLRKLSLMLE